MSSEFDPQAYIDQLRGQGADVRLSTSGGVLVVDFRPAVEKPRQLDLRPLIQFGRLRELYLPGCGVDDSLLGELTKLARLQTLDLRQTQVTEAGFARLASLEKLKLLLLSAGQVSDEFLSAFRRRMIGTRIILE